MSRDTLVFVLFLAALAVGIVHCLLWIAVGEVTVRKLRKNPETRRALGLEFMSGWDIANVSLALCRPRWIARSLAASPISWLCADQELLLRHTTRLDRVLARCHHASAWVSTLLLTASFAVQYRWV